jgi:hypothetical protein
VARGDFRGAGVAINPVADPHRAGDRRRSRQARLLGRRLPVRARSRAQVRSFADFSEGRRPMQNGPRRRGANVDLFRSYPTTKGRAHFGETARRRLRDRWRPTGRPRSASRGRSRAARCRAAGRVLLPASSSGRGPTPAPQGRPSSPDGTGIALLEPPPERATAADGRRRVLAGGLLDEQSRLRGFFRDTRPCVNW